MVQIKAYLYGALLVGLLGVVAWFAHHERTIQADKDHAAQAAADAKEIAHVNKVTADATATVQDLQVRLATTLAAPPPNPVVVRLCQRPAVSVPAGTSDQGAGPGSNGTGGPSAGVAGSSEQGPDIGPGTEVILNRLKGKLDYLQGYVRACQSAGVCDASP